MITPSRAPADGASAEETARATLIDALEPAALRALYAASRRLVRCASRTEVYDVVVGCAQALIGGAAVFFAPGHRSRALHLVAGLRMPDTTPTEISVPPQWLATIAEHGGLVRSDAAGIAESPLAILSARMAHGGVVVALHVAGAIQQYGMLVVAPQMARLAAPQDAALLALAGDGAHALDRITQLEMVWRDADMSGSNRLLVAVNAVTDIGLLYSNLLDQMLGAILAQILNALTLAGGAILLYNEQSEDLELAAALSGPGARPGSADLISLWQPELFAQSVAEALNAASHGRVLIVAAEDGAPISAALHSFGVSQLISVPLLAGGWLIGVLQVVATYDAPVADHQVQILHILARQTAVAIENARLFVQTRNDQERTSAVVDATNDAILMLDERRRVMIINRRARFFFGLSERELQEKDLDQLGARFQRIFEDAPRFQAWLRQLLRSATERAVEEFQIIRPEPRLLQCFSAPVMNPRDRYLGRILVFRDITREREVEQMKSDFVSNVSHELRTPLTSIQGAIQLVLGPSRAGRPGVADGLTQRARDLLTISLKNTERLIRLINDLLDIAKIEQGRIQFRRETLAPADLCRSAASEMRAFASNRDITIDLDLPSQLPKILADGDRSAQVLVNLLSNAIKFSPTGQQVLLSARHEGTMICFSVRDWGQGIARDDQARLFQRFLQIDGSATRAVGGTGLGLAISKALVEEQGGRIWLNSMPGKGSTFSFTLPVVTGQDLPVPTGTLRPHVLLVGLGLSAAAVRAGLAQAAWEVREVATTAMVPESAQVAPPDMLIVALPPHVDAAVALLDGMATDESTNTAMVLALGDVGGRARPGLTLLPTNAAADTIIATALAVMSTRQPHILVVDDDPHVRPVLVRLLQRHGLRVTNVGDGLAALAMIERLRPDVVLLDVKMPGIDGTEVLRRIKEDPAIAATRVIILAANDLGESLQAQVIGLGADGYLEKPITYERLISAVTTAALSGEVSHGR